MGIKTVEGCQIISLLKHEARIVGASGLMMAGLWLSLHAKAVILATGGAAGMYEVASAPQGVSGNGYAMALKSGIPVKNVEFNEFYPVGLPTKIGQYVHCAPATLMMKKAWLRNDEGEDIVKKHFGISLQDGVRISTIRFDWLPRAVALETERGNVWLELTEVPAEEWNSLPERNWKQIRRTEVDIRKTPLPIVPMSQSSRGGVAVGTRMQTPIEGLYAAGEVSGGWWSTGSGMSYLPSCLAMGAIAGRSAVADIEGGQTPPAELSDEGLEEAWSLATKEGKVNPQDVGGEIRHALYRCTGPVKSMSSLEEGLLKLKDLKKKTADFRCTNTRELKDALEAKAMLLAGTAIMKASFLRAESRGGFYRSDFPARDDEHWLRPVLVSYDRATDEVEAELGEKITPSNEG